MTDTAPCYLFLDCDRFYFAVEAAERPGLAGAPRPVIIGRDPRTAPRGIVTTANDPARALGIRSGLSAAIALRLAPNALFLPPRHELYERYSTRVMAVLRDESPLVEQHSIDEAASLWPHGFGPEPPLALRARVLAETGISRLARARHLATGRQDGERGCQEARRPPLHRDPGRRSRVPLAAARTRPGRRRTEGGGATAGGRDRNDRRTRRPLARRARHALRPGRRPVPLRRQPRRRSPYALGGTRGEEHLGRAHLPPRHHRPRGAQGATPVSGGGGFGASRAGGPQGRGGCDQAPLRQLADPDTADEAPCGHGRRGGPRSERDRADAAPLGPHARRPTDRPQSGTPHGRNEARAAVTSLRRAARVTGKGRATSSTRSPTRGRSAAALRPAGGARTPPGPRAREHARRWRRRS